MADRLILPSLFDPFGKPEPSRLPEKDKDLFNPFETKTDPRHKPAPPKPQLSITYRQRLAQARQEGPESVSKRQNEFIEAHRRLIGENLMKGKPYEFKNSSDHDDFFKALDEQGKEWSPDFKAVWAGLGMVAQSVFIDPGTTGRAMEVEGLMKELGQDYLSEKTAAANIKKPYGAILDEPSRISIRKPSQRGNVREAFRNLYTEQQKAKGERHMRLAAEAMTGSALKQLPKWLETERQESVKKGGGRPESFGEQLTLNALLGIDKVTDAEYLEKARNLLTLSQREKFDKLNPKRLSDVFQVPEDWERSSWNQAKAFLKAAKTTISVGAPIQLAPSLATPVKSLATIGEAGKRAGLDMQIIYALIGQGDDSPNKTNAEGKLNIYLNNQAKNYWMEKAREGGRWLKEYQQR